VTPVESVACAENPYVAARVGVPWRFPELESDMPTGRTPPKTDHVYGGTPPEAWRPVFEEYGIDTVPAGSVALVTVSFCVTEGVTSNWKVDDVAKPPEATCITTVKVPDAVGVPVIAPAPEMESPLGNPVAENAYGPVPPIAATLAEYAEVVDPTGRPVVVIPRTE
jgi:hypothetical protein